MADLAADPSVVPYWAWQLASKSMVGGTAASLTVEFIVGPNSVKDTAVAERGIRAAATLFRGTPQPDRTSVILFSYRDRDWAQQQWQSLTPASGNVFELSGCTSDKQCSVGVGATNGVDRGVVLLSTNLVGASSNLTPGSLLAHEYTHVIQGSQFFGNPQASESWCCIGRWLPRYLIEGQANWAQSAAMHPDDFAAYKRERRKLLRNLTDPGKLESQGIDLAYLEGFLSFQGDAWQRYDGSRFYDLGMLFAESLVALQGPEDLMRVVQRTGGGMEFADAFQQVYRVPFADAVPYLAKAMLKLGNGSGM